MNYLPIIRSHPYFLSYGSLHYFFSSIGQTFLISVSVPYMIEDLDISAGDFSNTYAIATISSAFLLPLAGKYVDRLPLKILSLFGGIGLIVASLVMFQVNHIIVLLFGLFLLRFFGQGSMILIGSTAIARSFDQNRGKALSISALGLALAETMTPVIFITIIHAYGWRTSWLVTAVLAFVVFIPLTQFLIRKSKGESAVIENKEFVKKVDFTRSQVLKDWRFYALLPAFLFLPFFITGIFIHHNMLAVAKGWTLEWLATCFIGYGIAKLIMSFIGGWLVDRFSAQKVFSYYLIPMATGLLILVFFDHYLLALLYMILVGITASLGSLVGVAVWAELYGTKNLGAIKSMVTMIMVAATALGPIVIGWGLERSMIYTLVISIMTIGFVTAMGVLALNSKGVDSY